MNENLKKTLLKPVTSAAIGAFALRNEFGPRAIFTVDGSIPIIGGISLGVVPTGAILGWSTSFIVELLNDLLHAVKKEDGLKTFPSFVTHIAGGAASFAILPKLVAEVGDEATFGLAKTGVMAEIASQWVYENFVTEGSMGSELLDLI